MPLHVKTRTKTAIADNAIKSVVGLHHAKAAGDLCKV